MQEPFSSCLAGITSYIAPPLPVRRGHCVSTNNDYRTCRDDLTPTPEKNLHDPSRQEGAPCPCPHRRPCTTPPVRKEPPAPVPTEQEPAGMSRYEPARPPPLSTILHTLRPYETALVARSFFPPPPTHTTETASYRSDTTTSI